MSLSVGDKLGPYEILAPIGAGGMGEVWKARDTRLDRIVAIKRLKGQHTARFEQEARAIAALNPASTRSKPRKRCPTLHRSQRSVGLLARPRHRCVTGNCRSSATAYRRGEAGKFLTSQSTVSLA
jgi:serine/threonine protein kinase